MVIEINTKSSHINQVHFQDRGVDITLPNLNLIEINLRKKVWKVMRQKLKDCQSLSIPGQSV